MALPARLRSGQAPVTVFDDETGIGGQDKIAGLAYDELESAFLQQRDERCLAGGADLLATSAVLVGHRD